MMLIVWYILAVGVAFVITGLWGIWDVHQRNLDVAMMVTATSRTLNGSVFVMAAMGLMCVARRNRTMSMGPLPSDAVRVRFGDQVVYGVLAEDGAVDLPCRSDGSPSR
jgi:hypothetical protein